MRTIKISLVAVLISFCMSAFGNGELPAIEKSYLSAEIAQQGPWVRLGVRKVNYGLDHDVIHVGANEGVYTKLKIVVRGGGLNMHKMVVTYGNGAKDNIPLRHNFRQASGSRVIDLKGNKRIIRSITFWYDSKNISNRRATIVVFGKK